MALDYLPTPNWAVVYGEVPSASKWSQLGTNDNSLATGSGIDDLAIITRHLADGAATTRKMKPSYRYVAGSQAARQSIGTGAYAAVAGASQSYTSGPTAEMLFIFGTCIANATAAGSQFGITANGTLAGKTDYDDQSGTFKGRFAFAIYEIPANTTVTFALSGKSSSGTTSVANATADLGPAYSPHLGIIAFGR